MSAPTFVAVLPAIDYDLATSCVQSMCWTLSRNLVLIDNSTEQKIADWADVAYGDALVAREPQNLGVPLSWNVGIDTMQVHDADYLIIVSQSVLFGASGGRDFLDDLADRRPKWIMHASWGWKLIALSAALIERVGIFDPMFAPAYFEETDYLLRMARAGLPSPRENGGELDQVVIDAECRGDALALKRGLVSIDLGAQEAKYVAKWNGTQGKETFATPYNDPSLDWRYTGQPPLSKENDAEEHSP